MKKLKLSFIIIMIALPIGLLISDWFQYKEGNYVQPKFTYFLLLAVFFVKGIYDLIIFVKKRDN